MNEIALRLRKWATEELLSRRNVKPKPNMKLVVNAPALPAVAPKVAMQENGCDCGVYLLEFAKRFLNRVAPRLDKEASPAMGQSFEQDFEEDLRFDNGCIAQSRREMHQFIENRRALEKQKGS